MLGVSGKVRDLRHTDDGKSGVPCAVKLFVVHGVDEGSVSFIGSGWLRLVDAGGFVERRHDHG